MYCSIYINRNNIFPAIWNWNNYSYCNTNNTFIFPRAERRRKCCLSRRNRIKIAHISRLDPWKRDYRK
ncbi:hypothetical protein GWI33_007253 [Rhynchophorus ferrugineus]|uniref:Uncharacterized protein n=1 Tax=Rhynchophorus ferrugineus TaxID=354439 RepID=A0A834MGT4_RHYFE|nr:hypothetical protein GWI33_007253 [Rhynchophorus ferrugineus]